MTGHGLFRDRDGFLEKVAVSSVALGLELLVIFSDFCETETFPEDHLLRVKDFSVDLGAEQRLMNKVVVVVLIALEGEDYLPVIYALGILYVCKVREALP